jgi:predicted outer membrane protein
MRRHIITSLLLVAPAAALAAQDTTQARYPQSNNTMQTKTMQAGSQDDRGLILKMHRGHLTEIRVGQLAQQNGHSAQVKQFGAQLVRDHQSANQELTRVAGQIGITLTHDTSQNMKTPDNRSAMPTERRDTTAPGNLPRSERRDTMQGNAAPAQAERAKSGADTTEDAQLIGRLSQLRGAEFDREFARAMVQSHEKKLRMLEQAQGQIQRSELRTVVQNTISAVRRHLQIAQSMVRTTTTSSIN